MNPEARTDVLKATAANLGFDYVGVSRAEYMEPEAARLEDWLDQGYHGRMAYMENHFDKRVDPTKLVPGAKSVISLMYNYSTETAQREGVPKISRYAYGEDYHHVIKGKLHSLLESLCAQIGEIHGRCFVDSAPVLERDWARRSGLGWVGKNTLLIHPKAGSYFFLAELIVDVEFAYDNPIRDHCGTCRKCIDACPTEAIDHNGYVMDGSKCISYLTIELRDEIPEEFSGKMENWVFGCDICQEVCPWNRFSSPHQEPAFEASDQLLEMTEGEWKEMTKEVFTKLFKDSPVKRTGYNGLKRNLKFIGPT